MSREEALRALMEKLLRDERSFAHLAELPGLKTDAAEALVTASGVSAAASRDLRAILDASPWIPVAERLPEGVDIVWGQWGTRVAVGLCVDGEWERSERGAMLPCAAPDYWQRYEMPEPYREES